ncbi:MAG: hypothetical protein J5846_03090, partial [Desulfovibrio sp.]|nr:hypothetical protein [Desulfovibrio sp.]
VAQSFVVDHKLPNGEAIDKEELTEDFSENKLAICDVDGDGKAELIVQFQSGSMASHQEFVCGFNESTGKISIKFSGFPGVEYFNNGCAKEMVSHNQGLAGEFWPYSFSVYNAKKGEYELKGSVDAWSKEAYPVNPFENDKPFPKEIDVRGDGFVYFIDDENFDGAKGADTPVDTPVYEAWVQRYIGGAEAIKVDWVSADEHGLHALETNQRTTVRK